MFQNHCGANGASSIAPGLLCVLIVLIALTPSTAENCGSGIGTCPDDQCCSQYGWCGSSLEYCGTGCQANWGRCSTESASPLSSAAPTPSRSFPATSSIPPSSASHTKGATINPTPSKQPSLSMSMSRSASASRPPIGSISPYATPQRDTSPSPDINATPTTRPTSPRDTDAARVITTCAQPGTVAITFDDGPFFYFDKIMDALDAVGAKATFFINGYNWRCVYDAVDSLHRATENGHQIASHTWSHPDLVTITESAIADQLTQLDDALEKILGFSPTYMRPPFGSYNEKLMDVLPQVHYKANVMWDIDSGDTVVTMPEQMALLNDASTTEAHIILNHDTVQSTADTLVPFIISWAQSRNLRMVTVGECLGDPPSGWYKNHKVPEQPDCSWVCKR